MVGMMGCVVHETGASEPTHDITEISIEHDCFGCASGQLLVLRKDGSALSKQVGKARMGTLDTVQRGTVSRADFHRLAQLLSAHGFFQMKAVYQDEALQDGAWYVVRATRDQSQTEVFARDDAAPHDLKVIAAELDAAKRQIQFKP